MKPPKFTVIITNYNYGDYVAAAIDSALALDWPDVEVMVVDDGSTDRSWDVIQGYGDTITALRVPNGGQNACINIAVPRSSGDIVMLLDSDDALQPEAPSRIAAVWTAGTAKVQFALQYYDATMSRKGQAWPVYDARHTPEYMLDTLRRTGSYPHSVTSGNAWSRRFLVAALPLPSQAEMTNGPDQFLSRLAPLFGEVVSLPDILARYRVHSSNVSQIGTFSIPSFERLIDRETIFHRELTATLQRHGLDGPAENRSEPMIMGQVICKKLVGGPKHRYGGWVTLLGRYWTAVRTSETTPGRKAAMAVWSLLVTVLPRPFAYRVCSLRQRAIRRF